MKKFTSFASLLLMFSILFTSCKKENDTTGNNNDEIPPLKDVFKVNLGAENVPEGSYLATSTEVVYTTGEADANKDIIDITLGEGTGDNKLAAAGLISAKDRTNHGLPFGNGGQSGVVATVFNEEPTIANLDDEKADAEFINNIKTTGSTTMVIAAGKTYSFSNSLGKKGLIYIDKITDAGENAIATMYVKVQK